MTYHIDNTIYGYKYPILLLVNPLLWLLYTCIRKTKFTFNLVQFVVLGIYWELLKQIPHV